VTRISKAQKPRGAACGFTAGDATNKLDHSGRIYVKRTRSKPKEKKLKRKVFA